jgi:Xaa-Pro dipeptidase
MSQAISSIFSQSSLTVDRAVIHGLNRSKLVDMMREKGAHGAALLRGGSPFHLYATDGELLFKQEAFFFYLFGVPEEGYSGCIDLESGKATLFMPRLPDSYAVWMGPLATPDAIKARYAVDEVFYEDDLGPWLEASKADCIHVLLGVNSDSGLTTHAAELPSGVSKQIVVNQLFSAIAECRVKKSEHEINIIRYANRVGSEAHLEVLRRCRPGLHEYQLESTFLHHCYDTGGCRTAQYIPIAASGPNGAILHYGHAGAPNNRTLEDGDLVLCDFGCSIYNYGSDITTTFPANGKFTSDQRLIYESVLAANEAVKNAMRPSVSWPDMHKLANRVILQGLNDGGLLTGSIDEMMEVDLGAVFMPHGLGHFLGIDTHDVGGYIPGHPDRIQRPGLNKLRTARLLEAGMVITVEPGCYFNPCLLLPAFEDPKKSKFFVIDRIRGFIGMGGVRIEDNVVITANGIDNLTRVPRTVDEIERVMAGGAWP